MTFQGQVLLPSQEALIQRLHHVASYSDQLLVLVGAQGSGKTTLLTALATDVDDSNTALVICPMHADNAEIRRKILVQLMSSPIFDDEIPLAETILRVAPNQSKPLHIIIDDAHLLSKELWAECIILNQVFWTDCPTRSEWFYALAKRSSPAAHNRILCSATSKPFQSATAYRPRATSSLEYRSNGYQQPICGQ